MDTAKRRLLSILASLLLAGSVAAPAQELEVQNWKEIGAIDNGPLSLVVECFLVGNAAWTEVEGGARIRIRGGRGGVADYAFFDLDATEALAAAVEQMLLVDPEKLPFATTVAEYRAEPRRGDAVAMRLVPSTGGRRADIQVIIGSEAMGVPAKEAGVLVQHLRTAHAAAIGAGARSGS